MDSRTSREHQEYLWHGERRDGAAPPGRLSRPVAGPPGSTASLGAVVFLLSTAALLVFHFCPPYAAWPCFLAAAALVARFADALTALLELLLLLCLASVICWSAWTFVAYIAVI